MPHPTVEDWKKYDSILASGSKGFNGLVEIPKLLSKEYSWLQDFEFGFSTKEDIPIFVSRGWRFLEVSHLGGIDEFNAAISLPFGLSDDSGHVRWRGNYVMIMPKDFRKRQIKARNDNTEREYEKTIRGRDYIPEGDAGSSCESSYDEFVVSPSVSGPQQRASFKTRRGRPPKN